MVNGDNGADCVFRADKAEGEREGAVSENVFRAHERCDNEYAEGTAYEVQEGKLEPFERNGKIACAQEVGKLPGR